MVTRALPTTPNLEQLRKQAKDLLKAWRAGDPEALRRIEAQLLERLHGGPDGSSEPGFRLATAQLVIAREYGFASWARLKREVELRLASTAPSKVQTEVDGATAIHWASRVNPRLVRQLYQTDAREIVDEEMIDEVGYALLARCRSILEVTEAQEGRVACPCCRQLIVRAARAWERKDEVITCAGCGWRVRWGDYVRSYQGKHLSGGGATDFHRIYVDEFGRARTPGDKMLAIDRLIHAFHWELVAKPGRSAARELIYAKNNEELLTLLDRLAYGEGSTPGLRERKAEWDRKLESSPWHLRTGFGPKRAIPREGD